MPDINVNTDMFQHISEDLKVIHDMVSRGDERLLFLIRQQQDQDGRLEKMMSHQNTLTQRVVLLESRGTADLRRDIEDLKVRLTDAESKVNRVVYASESTEAKWKGIVSFGIQLLLACMSAWMVFKLGIKGS